MSESEVRNALDLPGIDGIEDLDGDVDGLDVHLDDLSSGDVVTYHEQDRSHRYVVTGRHESRSGALDQTDVIELKALNPSSSTVSEPRSVASLHHRAARGEIEVETGWRSIVTWLRGRGSYHLETLWTYRIRGQDDAIAEAERDESV